MSKCEKSIKVSNQKTTQCSIRQSDTSKQQNNKSIYAINVTTATAATTTTKTNSIDCPTKSSGIEQRHRYFRYDPIVRLEVAVSRSRRVRLGRIFN